MQSILPIFHSIFGVRGCKTSTALSKFTVDSRVNIILRDIIGMVPTPTSFIPYRFNIPMSFLRVHRNNDPNILVFKCHNSFLKVDNYHTIIILSNPLQSGIGATIFDYLYHIEISMRSHTFNVDNQIRDVTNGLHLSLVC